MIDLEKIIDDAVERALNRRGLKSSDAVAFLSVAEAASVARVTPGTIRRWVRHGDLTRHEAGSKVLVRRDELERLLTVGGHEPVLSIEERALRRFG